MKDAAALDFIHPFYVASDLPDLDQAYEDGKRRAISVLRKRIDAIAASSRADYEDHFLVKKETH